MGRDREQSTLAPKRSTRSTSNLANSSIIELIKIYIKLDFHKKSGFSQIRSHLLTSSSSDSDESLRVFRHKLARISFTSFKVHLLDGSANTLHSWSLFQNNTYKSAIAPLLKELGSGVCAYFIQSINVKSNFHRST